MNSVAAILAGNRWGDVRPVAVGFEHNRATCSWLTAHVVKKHYADQSVTVVVAPENISPFRVLCELTIHIHHKQFAFRTLVSCGRLLNSTICNLTCKTHACVNTKTDICTGCGHIITEHQGRCFQFCSTNY